MHSSGWGCASVAFWVLIIFVEIVLNGLVECVGEDAYRAACNASTHREAIIILIVSIVLYGAALAWSFSRGRDTD